MIFKGKAWRFGDDVDTDVIIPARYLTSADARVLAAHCLEDLRPGFSTQVRPGDIVVAGRNFGCGSSREHAPLVLKEVGVSVVVARSFARIFYRNAFNIGLPAIESVQAADAIEDGDEVRVELAAGVIHNETKGETYESQPVPQFMLDLISRGGLMRHLAEGGWR
jgi:3-isopropylmalate/(R)-2-methylmalate dehydratase small subunit